MLTGGVFPRRSYCTMPSIFAKRVKSRPSRRSYPGEMRGANLTPRMFLPLPSAAVHLDPAPLTRAVAAVAAAALAFLMRLIQTRFRRRGRRADLDAGDAHAVLLLSWPWRRR